MRVKGQNLQWDETLVGTKKDQSESSWAEYFHKPYASDWSKAKMEARQRKARYQIIAEGWKEHDII